MKVKPITIFLAAIAAVLGLLVYADLQGPGNQTNSDSAGEPLFSFEEDDVEAFTIQTDAATVSLSTDDDGNWQMTEPELAPANDASVAYLLNLLTTEESDRSLTVPAAEADNFGLNLPLATVDIELANQETHRLVLGNYDFNRSFLYAQTDPDAEENDAEINVQLVSPNFENAVNLTAEEWKQPPAEEATENEADGAVEDGSIPDLSPTPSP